MQGVGAKPPGRHRFPPAICGRPNHLHFRGRDDAHHGIANILFGDMRYPRMQSERYPHDQADPPHQDDCECRKHLVHTSYAARHQAELHGRVLPGGGDFLLVDPSGVGHVDARLTWELTDGTIVYVQYLGRVVMSEKIAEAFKTGEETVAGDTYFVTQILFEVGDGPYGWLNSIVAIGEGRVAPGRSIQYAICRCEHA